MSRARVDFRNVDLEQIVRVWNDFFPPEFKVSPSLFAEKTINSDLFDWGASAVEMDGEDVLGFVTVKKSAAQLYRGPDPDAVHLNSIAFKSPAIGVDLLANVKQVLKNRGNSKLIFGTDNGHFFPGCPVNASQLVSFLMVEGFQSGGESVDLERDLTDYEFSFPVPENSEMRMLTEADKPSLARFFAETFPGRWRYDVEAKCLNSGIENCLFGLVIEGRVEGMALIQDAHQAGLIGGAVWNESLEENWGSLGPIGISEPVRGKGLGNALLGYALLELKRRGTARCIIDWTGLIEFYGKHGFKPTRRYRSMALPLETYI